MQSTANPLLQPKQHSKYLDARKYLSAHQLLEKNSPCMAPSIANAIVTLAETYRMPENVAKVLGHITEVLWHTEQPTQEVNKLKALTELIKELQNNLSAEMDNKLTVLERKLTLLSSAQEQLQTTAKEIGQVAVNIKPSISNMGNSITQVADTSSQLANTATSYKDPLLTNREQPQQF